MAGDEYQLSVFLQEYNASTSTWTDDQIVGGTSRNDMYTPSIATPVMQAFVDLAEGADEALADIQAARDDAVLASDAIDAIEDRIVAAESGFGAARSASEAATTQADAQDALDQLNGFKTDIDAIKVELEAELARIATAQAVADDAELEADAQFEVPIRNEFTLAKQTI